MKKVYLLQYKSLPKYCCDSYNTHGDHFVTSKWKYFSWYDSFEKKKKRKYF